VAAGAAAVLGACATANTPQQNLAYERWAKCDPPGAGLQRIDLDGRITFVTSNASTQDTVLRCLAEAGRGGPPLPAPVATHPAGGV
jgi:hypothetical protein